MPQQELLIRVLSVLDRLGIEAMVTGSTASSLQGEPRATHDIDLVVNLSAENAELLGSAFPEPDFYLDPVSIKEAIRDRSMFNAIDLNEGDKVDFWILTNDAFDRSRFNRRYFVEAFGIRIPVSSPEDTILAKLRWAKLSGGSEKQFTDALRVYEVQATGLDLTYLVTWVRHLDVQDLWDQLQREADPI